MKKLVCDVVLERGRYESRIIFQVLHMEERLRICSPKDHRRVLCNYPETGWCIVSSSYPGIDIWRKEIHVWGHMKEKDDIGIETPPKFNSVMERYWQEVKETIAAFNSAEVKMPRLFRNRFEMLEI